MHQEIIKLPQDNKRNNLSKIRGSREIIIVQTDKIIDLAEKLCELSNLRWCYLGDNWQIYNALKGDLESFGKELSSGRIINDKAKCIRREYLNFEKIVSAKMNKLLWQSTDLAEKSLINNSLFLDVCKSLVYQDLIDTHSEHLLFIVDDIFLGEFLRSTTNKKYLKNFIYKTTSNINSVNKLIVESLQTSRQWKKQGLNEINTLRDRLLYQRKYIQNYRQEKRKKAITNQDIDILICVWGTPNSFFHDKFKENDSGFGYLPAKLLKSGEKIAYLVLPVDWQYPFTDIIDNAIGAKDDVYILQDCIDINEAKELAMKGLNEPLLLDKRFFIEGIDFTALLKKSFLHEKSKSRQFWALCFYFVSKFFCDNNIKVSSILLGYENQPWEKSLRRGFRQWMPDTKICQYVSGAIGKFWLSAYPGQEDIKNGDVPDLLAVYSKKCKKHFMDEGFRNSQLAVWPAYRNTNLLNTEYNSITQKTNLPHCIKLRVLISANISHGSTLELLSKTFLATISLKHLDFRIRLHPRMGSAHEVISNLKNVCKWKVYPKNISISKSPSLIEDLNWTDVVVIMGSGVEIEAALSGCYTILVGSDCAIDNNYLDLHEHNTVVRSVDEIYQEFSRLYRERKNLIKTPWEKEKTQYYFEPYTDESQNRVIMQLKKTNIDEI